MKPTPGRIVHFIPPTDNVGPKSIKLVAAIVTSVYENQPPSEGTDHVDLATFGTNSLYFQHCIPFSEKPEPGHWSWPAKV